jgi:hypothetical protein
VLNQIRGEPSTPMSPLPPEIGHPPDLQLCKQVGLVRLVSWSIKIGSLLDTEPTSCMVVRIHALGCLLGFDARWRWSCEVPRGAARRRAGWTRAAAPRSGRSRPHRGHLEGRRSSSLVSSRSGG